MLIFMFIFIANICGAFSEHYNIYGITLEKFKRDVQFAGSPQNDDLDLVHSAISYVSKNGLGDSEDLLSGDVLTDRLDPTCLSALGLVYKHRNESWVKAILDSLGKPSSGLYKGNMFWVGDYDECLSVHASIENATQMIDISGRYCLATIQIKPLSNSIKWGVCIPSQCHAGDLTAIIDSVLRLVPPVRKSAYVKSLKCDEDSIPMTTGAKICIAILSLIALLLLVGTLYDVSTYRPFWQTYVEPSFNDLIEDKASSQATDSTPLIVKTNNPGIQIQRTEKSNAWRQFLISFSLYNNTRKLFTIKESPTTVKGLDGFRVLSLAWVILGHCFIFSFSFIRNPLDVLTTFPNKIANQPILSSFYSVDSFFFMSGLLVTFHLMNSLRAHPSRLRSSVTWIMFYVHRYIRLTPFYMLILMTYLLLSQYWSTGPFSTPRAADYENCKEYWWTNLLYINNFWTLSKNCFGWSWYLANDMQFYAISPLIIIGLYLKPLVGFIIVAALMVMQFIYRGVVSAQLHIPLGEVWFTSNLTQLVAMIKAETGSGWQHYYTAPYSRIAPYLVGMLTGYTLSRGPVRLSKTVVLAAWTACVTVMFTLLYGCLTQERGHPNPNALNATFNSVNKALWGLVVAWVIYATNVGHGGMAGEFLSWRGWAPIARLTYAGYLIHPLIITYYLENLKTPVYFTTYSVVIFFFGIWVMTYLLSYIVSMCFEAPLLALEKIILPRN